ncbi:transcriptional regulator WhiB-like [Mycobacterium phage Kumao]|uniref:WhiB family transcription factor n=1 Tax=Mycobacterium phage Kumao TaxID=2041344 RepID=A0A2D1GPQ7_9CAUD|nr:transcriptional regulator WhiB-like [Mycobacterium phage Kumao]ATN94029.1 WhiB family transcription factor [Mycobacterium phage Kumao]
MKLWQHGNEWVSYANCGGVIDHILPPEREDDGPVADQEKVEFICNKCQVRPECAKWAVRKQAHGVWACGRYIPGHDEDRRQANRVRRELAETIHLELARRGDDF